MMDYKRMWMHLVEEVEEEAEERAFYFLESLLADMESMEQFEADGMLAEYKLKRQHREVICDYGIAWGTLKGQLEELLVQQEDIDIVDLLEFMEDIEYGELKALFDEEDGESEAR